MHDATSEVRSLPRADQQLAPVFAAAWPHAAVFHPACPEAMCRDLSPCRSERQVPRGQITRGAKLPECAKQGKPTLVGQAGTWPFLQACYPAGASAGLLARQCPPSSVVAAGFERVDSLLPAVEPLGRVARATARSAAARADGTGAGDAGTAGLAADAGIPSTAGQPEATEPRLQRTAGQTPEPEHAPQGPGRPGHATSGRNAG